MAFLEASYSSCYAHMLINHMGAAFHQDTSPCSIQETDTSWTPVQSNTIYNSSSVIQWPAAVINTIFEKLITHHTSQWHLIAQVLLTVYPSIYRSFYCWKIWHECSIQQVNSRLDLLLWMGLITEPWDSAPDSVDTALAFTSSSPRFNIFPGWRTAN